MHAESNIRPDTFEINILTDDTAEINFFENIKETVITNEFGEKRISYDFDMYTINVQNRNTLEREITLDLDGWLSCARLGKSKYLSEKERLVVAESVIDEIIFEIIPSLVEGQI